MRYELVELMTILFHSRSTYDSVRFNAGPGPNYSSLGRYLVLILTGHLRTFPISNTKMPMENAICQKYKFVFDLTRKLSEIFFLWKLQKYCLINEIDVRSSKLETRQESLRSFSMCSHILETVNKTHTTKIQTHQYKLNHCV